MATTVITARVSEELHSQLINYCNNRSLDVSKVINKLLTDSLLSEEKNIINYENELIKSLSLSKEEKKLKKIEIVLKYRELKLSELTLKTIWNKYKNK